MKKIISLLLCFVMTFSMIPVNIFAIDASEKAILEEAPVGLVYCYADLHDPDLHRGELDNAIQKDYDNEELKYSMD